MTDNTAQVEHMTVTTQKTQGIVITPAVLMVAVFGLFQLAIGIGMWSLQSKINDYDGYEPRIVKVENSLIRLEDIPTNLKILTDKLDSYTKEQLSEKDVNDKINPVVESLHRIEQGLDKINTGKENNSSNIKDLDNRINIIEREIEFIKKTK